MLDPEDILAAPIVDSHQAGLLENMARDSEQETRRTAHTIRTALASWPVFGAGSRHGQLQSRI